MIRKVVVGVSGGVDSAVATLLLKNKGFNVQAVFMKNWDTFDEIGQCNGEKEFADAEWICSKLNVPLLQVNFVKEYWNDVFGSFLADYQKGLTPNPDIKCNAFVKFSAFYKYAREHLSADAIATGHYARTSFGNFLDAYREDKNVKLLCPLDQFKDQTFFLSQVPQLGLRRAMFPLGNLLKCDVKLLATRSGLHQIAKKRESAGICFIGKRNLHDFISEYVDRNPGEFVDVETGQLLGTHEGIHFWTVGQRARIGGAAKKMYILRKQNDGKTITLCSGGNHPGLFTNILYTEKPHWIDANPFGYANIVRCKFRFQHMDRLIGCTMCPTVDGLFIKLDLPLRALTPGQYAVFYANDECLGGARITNPGPSLLYGTEVERSQIGDTYKQHHQIQKINESALFSPEEICEITGGNS